VGLEIIVIALHRAGIGPLTRRMVWQAINFNTLKFLSQI